IASIAIDPPMASILVESGGPAATQPFKAVATYTDGSTGDVGGSVAWTASNLQVGNIASSGLYTTSGSIGGAGKIHASYQGKTAGAKLSVKPHVLEAAPGIAPAVVTALKGASVKDAAVQWAYPYDGTVFPRGLAGPLLMWNNGAAADIYYVHVTSATFELE